VCLECCCKRALHYTLFPRALYMRVGGVAGWGLGGLEVPQPGVAAGMVIPVFKFDTPGVKAPKVPIGAYRPFSFELVL
jgi:hypothetical protein